MTKNNTAQIFTLQRYASTVYAIIVCLSVRPHAGNVSKRLN